MDHFQNIYANHSDRYDELVSHEDTTQLFQAINEIIPLASIDVVEFGAGTGRLTTKFAQRVKSVRAFDASSAMLDVARKKLETMGVTNWELDTADNRSIPASDSSADLAIEGWSFGHSRFWYPDSWKDEVGKMLDEMQRVLRPGGVSMLIEIGGNNVEQFIAINEGLAEFFAWLENNRGYSFRWVRMDQHYDSPEQAEELQNFFFQGQVPEGIKGKKDIPEVAGIWWRRKE